MPTRSLPRDSQRRLAFALILVLGVGVLWILSPYISGIFGAAVLYVALVPVHRRLARRIPAHYSALALTIGSLVLVLGPGAWLLTLIISETPDVVQRALDSNLIDRLRNLHIGNIALGAQVAEAAKALLSWTSTSVLSAFGQVTQATLNLVIALLGFYFLLLGADDLWNRTRGLLPFSDENVEMLRNQFFSVTQAMVLGTLLTSLLQGTVVGIGFAIVGLPYPIFWAVVTGIASILPILGSAIVWLPGVLVLAAQGRYGGAIILAVIGAVIASNLDNVVRPVVYRQVSNLHPMTTLLGAFAGVTCFGLIGVLLGPLAISFFFELVEIYRREYGIPNGNPDQVDQPIAAS